jgi:dipeptidyl aminopeptidase/acylaminoacyl peptidase
MTRRTTLASAIALGIALLRPEAAAAADARAAGEGLSLDALSRLSTFSLYSTIGSLSPDGRRLAYAVRRCNPTVGEGGGFHGAAGMRAMNEGCSDLRVIDTRTGAEESIAADGVAEDAAWSHDGKRLAFYSAPDGAAGLWIWDLGGKSARRAGTAIVRPSIFDDGAAPRWMPDGRCVVALVLPEGQTVAQANARLEGSAAADPSRPGESKIAVFRSAPAPPAEKSAAASPRVDPIQRETSDLAKVAMGELARIDGETGETRRLTPEKAIFWYAPSPDGKWVAYAHMTGFHQGWNARVYAIEVVPATGGPPRVLAEDVYPDQGVCTWSPDGTRLAYATGLEGAAVAQVHVLDVASGKDSALVAGNPSGPASWKNGLVPLWTPDGNTVVFAAQKRVWAVAATGGPIRAVSPTDLGREVVHLLSDASGSGVFTRDGGRSVLVTTRHPETKDAGFFLIDIATGRASKRREEPKDYVYAAPVVARNGSFLVFRSQDVRHPPEIWGAASDLADARPLTRVNREIEKVRLGTARAIEFLGSEGQRLRAALLLPPDFQESRPVPMIVQVYPGDYQHADEIHKFGFGDTSGPFNMQMLATRGYAVLFPETPQRLGTPARDLAENTNAAIDRAIALGIADPRRLGVFGHSYGGFSALSLITQTDRFRAAVVSGGFGDLFAFYGEVQDSGLDAWTTWVENDARMGGPPWLYRDRYIENSPLFHLDRVRTPLLILHGTEDRNVRAFYATQVFSYLRRLGQEVELRQYRGEGHVVQARDNVADYWNSVLRWFGGHLTAEDEKGKSSKGGGRER